MLRLLIPTEKSEVLQPSIVLSDGRRWEVVDASSLPNVPAYICISFAWGDSPIPNPMYGGSNLMSARTINVLQTTIRAVVDEEYPAIWIDSFCIPPIGDSSRTDALDRMGDIYSEASKVVVVLSESSYAFLKLAKDGISGQANMTHTPALEALEKDTWVTRAWTYQEIANSNDWSFVTEGHPEDTMVNGMDLLNALGNTRMAYCRPYRNEDGTIRTPDTETTVRFRFPNVDLFEDALAECRVAKPLERSALQTMSSVTRRIRERGEDYFNAMIGAIAGGGESGNSIRMDWKNMVESPLVQELENQLVFSQAGGIRTEGIVDFILKPMKVAFAANRFMQTCERNGDYSFIYTTTDRSEIKGQSWRPVADVLKPICLWHNWGTGQPGDIKDGGLELQEMLSVQLGNLSGEATQFIRTWVRFSYPDEAFPVSVDNVEKCLKEVGFSTTDENVGAIMLRDGYFFRQKRVDGNNVGKVFVSSTIRWVFGAPAIMMAPANQDLHAGTFISVGIFVGDVYEMEKRLGKVTVRLE